VAFQSIIIEKQHVMVLYATTHTWGESGTIDRKSHRVVPLGKMCHPLKGLVHLKKKKKNLRFLMKTFQDFSPYNGLHWVPNGSRSK